MFFDMLAEKQQKEGGVTEQKIEVPLSRRIVLLLYLSFVVVAGLFVFKTFQFQILNGSEYSELATRNTVRNTPVLSDRGLIYDNTLQKLAVNQPSFDVVCDKRDMPQSSREKERILFGISDITNQDQEETRERFEEHTSPKFVIAESLEHEQLVLMESRISEF
ncbi:MAG: hypothetical protein QF775_00460, partial [archaeon]|nr:hypothetical protein [archaeon]